MPTTADAYRRNREGAAVRNKATSLAGRDIGDIPPVRDFQRKVEGTSSLKRFCETYFPQTFTKPWSDDHIRVLAKLEQAIRHGGRRALAMPRGQGKTSICQAGTLFGLLTGLRRFIMLVGAAEPHASHLLQNLKAELLGDRKSVV